MIKSLENQDYGHRTDVKFNATDESKLDDRPDLYTKTSFFSEKLKEM